MTIYAEPPQVAVDATSLVILVGPPDRAVTWSLTGSGTLTIISPYTNEDGLAMALYTPDDNVGETVIVEAEYGV